MDFTDKYERIMQFDKNKSEFIHKWYPFVEGYSKEFITSVINELNEKPRLCADPFAGSGTTPLELQNLGINCYSFEVSPFMHLLASVKLETTYKLKEFDHYLSLLDDDLNGKLKPIRQLVSPPGAKTFQKKKNLKKWIFDRSVMDGILDIKYAISAINDIKYQKLFKIALASILLEISNVYRDGKSVKYKANWENRRLKRRDVHTRFFEKLTSVIQPDIKELEGSNLEVKNGQFCIHGDVRINLNRVENDSLDLVISSPPYLNSRDYTDIYIVELWVLDLIKDYDELRMLRGSTIRSHVQVKHGNVPVLDNEILRGALNRLNSEHPEQWNKELPGMIKGYFQDMNLLFGELSHKMSESGKIFFNVANSAYYGVEIEVDNIIAEIAEQNGFQIDEIRKARDLKPSSQQKDLIDSLRETVIVMSA